MSHKHAILAGTFDRIHDGHISCLKVAFESSDRVTIGLTTSKLHSDKEFSQIIQTYDFRKKELLKVIKQRWPQVSATVLPIENIYGSSVKDSTIDAIVVTEVTLQNGKKVNVERVRRGLNELKLIICPIIPAQDNMILSSSRIRRGEIDREGKVYSKAFSRTLSLPETLRSELREPLGRVIIGGEDDKDKVASEMRQILEKEKYSLSIAVGDVVSSTLENAGFSADIRVIDFKTHRKFLPSFSSDHRFDTENIAGTIDAKSAKLLQKEIEKVISKNLPKGQSPSGRKTTITIDGEEDLLVLPTVLLAPLESVVFYGQKDVGMVMIRVTEEIKKQVEGLIKRFT